MHWLIVAVASDWHKTRPLSSAEFTHKIGKVVFQGKAGSGVPKVLVAEDYIDITDVNDVVWAFATRTHPGHGEVHCPAEPHVALSMCLSEGEAHSYRAGKVVYNCLLAALFNDKDRPVKGSFENGWPAEIQQRVLNNRATTATRFAAPDPRCWLSNPA